MIAIIDNQWFAVPFDDFSKKKTDVQ